MPVRRRVPSPADAPTMTARALLSRIEQRGGRVHRMREWAVFVITEDEELAEWLLDLGGRPYLPRNATPTDIGLRGAYRNHPGGQLHWDIYIHLIPVKGEETIWETAKKRKTTALFEVE